ncbi:hypothetical protein NQ317_018584 [Molorchus minor]|uniref:Protein kinase domain-containing protein n=1 Tax=Molorchus minor TaxID=1323400 RepID=A0ABQ9IZ93_9CUCU|nr:hypothetical protein NQ317_018584 [Molorchus minor]
MGLKQYEPDCAIAPSDNLPVVTGQAYGKVFLVRKRGGSDNGRLYAMKSKKKKTTEHTKTERQVLEAVRDNPFLVTLHYAFQTDAKLHLILDYVAGGELFTHLYQRDRFTEDEVRIYIGEIILALEHLHTTVDWWSMGVLTYETSYRNELDVSNFSEEFTAMPATHTHQLLFHQTMINSLKVIPMLHLR